MRSHGSGALEVILSEEAYRRARRWLEGQPLSPIEASLSLKGFPEPLLAYRLAAPVSEAT
jgi:hypothetical protein